MDFWAGLTTILLIQLMGLASPGPDLAMVMRNSIVHSRRVGLFTTVGLTLGVSIHMAYCLLGIGFIISQSILAFNVIKFLGAAYLIYIGIKSLRAQPVKTSNIDQKKKTMTDWQAIKCGFLTNLLNPKVSIFFLSIFTVVITVETPLWQKATYGIAMGTLMLIWFSMVTFVFSNKHLKEKLIKIQHWIERIFGIVLIGLGLKVALTKM